MKKLAILSLSMLLLWSCSEESLSPTTAVLEKSEVNNTVTLTKSVIDNIEMNGNHLVLSSQQDFENAIQAIKEDDKFITALSAKFPNFVSAKSAFEAITDEMLEQNGVDQYEHLIEIKEDADGKKTIEPEIDMSTPSYLANEQGVLQIGTKVLKFTHNNVYQLDEADLSNFNVEQPTNIRSLEVFPVTRTVTPLRAVVKSCTNVYSISSPKRVRGEIKVTNSFPFSEVVVVTKHEEYTNSWFIGYWNNTNAGQLGMNGKIVVKAEKYIGRGSDTKGFTLNETRSNLSKFVTEIAASGGNRKYTVTAAKITHSARPSMSSPFTGTCDCTI